MFETLDKLMMAGLGAISMTRDRAERMFDEFVRRGEAEDESRAGFVRDVMDSAERTRRDLENIIARQIELTIARLNLATREDIARLEAKLDRMHSGSLHG